MTIYYSVEGAVNRPEISRAAADSIVAGRYTAGEHQASNRKVAGSGRDVENA